ncbi:MAG: dihydroorotase [Pseudomonadota bacterium]
MALLIKNGRVLDPASGLDDTFDILIAEGKIQEICKGIDISKAAISQEINAKNLIVAPGLIDMHTHLREPGHEYKETIQTGSRSAAAGGFTTIVCMANTNPVNDAASVTKYILEKARLEACVNVLPVAAITKGLQGESLAEMGDLKAAGIVAVSDDGKTIKSAEVMRRGLEYARSFSLPVICHCEDSDLSKDGVMHEGFTSMCLGMRGIPPAAEEVIVAREIALSEWTGHPVHIAHVSTAGSVRIIRKAKARGVPVTAETAPHYFTLTDAAVAGFDTSTKVNPPLRSGKDVEAIQEGLRDGTIDAIASDHAPHSSLEKDIEFDNAAFGMIGLETSLPLTLALVHKNILTLAEAIAKYTINPARILHIDKGTISLDAPADLTLIDLEAEFEVDRKKSYSKSKNSPFHGWRLKGRAAYTIVAGRVVFPFNT